MLYDMIAGEDNQIWLQCKIISSRDDVYTVLAMRMRPTYNHDINKDVENTLIHELRVNGISKLHRGGQSY